jgi:hypothetical protein
MSNADRAQLQALGTTPAGAEVAVEAEPQPRGWLNALLVRRKETRGDLVGSLALWAFLALICQILLGGSTLDVGGLHIQVPMLNWEVLAGLLAPIVGHVAKSTVEGMRQ